MQRWCEMAVHSSSSTLQSEWIVSGAFCFEAAGVLGRVGTNNDAALSTRWRRLHLCWCRRQRPVSLMMMMLLLSGCGVGRRVLFIMEGISPHEIRTLVNVFYHARHELYGWRRKVCAWTAGVRRPVRRPVDAIRPPVRRPVRRYAVTVRLPSGQTLQTHASVLIVTQACWVSYGPASDWVRYIVMWGLVDDADAV